MIRLRPRDAVPPCYEELITLTEQAEAARSSARTHRRQAVLLAVAAAIIIVAAASFLLLRGRLGSRHDPWHPVPQAKNTPPPGELPVAVLNLESAPAAPRKQRAAVGSSACRARR
jgi:hypothetical protein